MLSFYLQKQSFYVNLSSIFGTRKITEGSFDNETVIRTATISSQYNILIITLRPLLHVTLANILILSETVCLFYVILCLFYVYFMFILCLFYVYFMFILCYCFYVIIFMLLFFMWFSLTF
jgi:hypothetical protein